jgi:hypothetical protein
MSKNPLEQRLVGLLHDRIRDVMKREGCSVDEAIDIILREIGAKENRRVSQGVLTGAAGAEQPLEILRARPFGHLAKKVRVYEWGFIITYRGTETELLKHNRCPERMFREMGSSGRKASGDGYGNKYYLNRRAKGTFMLEVHIRKDPEQWYTLRKPDISPIWTQLGIDTLPDKFPEGPLARQGGAS